MTKEELRIIENDYWEEKADPIDITEVFDLANKAIEQEPILDKIRAEIEQIADEEQKHDEKWAIGLRYAVKIIDKYNVERRDK